MTTARQAASRGGAVPERSKSFRTKTLRLHPLENTIFDVACEALNGMERTQLMQEAGPMRKIEAADSRPQVLARDGDALWTSQDVADFLRVSLRWVEKQRALNLLPCLPLPGRRLIRYDPATIRAWALQRATDGRTGPR